MLDENDLLNLRLIIREEVQHESQKMYDKLHEEIIVTRVELSQKIDRFEERVETRFTSLDNRFNSVDNRFNSVDKHINSLDARFNSVDTRLNSMETEIKGLKRKVNKFPKDMEVLARHFEKDRIDLDQRVDKIEHHLSIS